MISIERSQGVDHRDVPLMRTVYYAFFVSGMMSTLIGAILPSMKAEYRMSYVLGGAVISAHQIGNFLALLIAGVLPYLIGRKKSTMILSLGIVIGFMAMTVTDNPVFLLLAFVCTGIGRGTLSNITNVVVGEVAKNRTAGLNILHASFAVGAFLAPFVVLVCIKAGNGNWRAAAWLLVVLELCAIVAWGRSALSDKPTHRLASEKERTFLHHRGFWLNTSILFFYLCGEASIVGWLVTYFTETGILSPALAQTTASALWVCILIGRLGCAFLSRNMDRNVLLLLLGGGQLLFFLLMIGSDSVPLIYAGILGFGLSLSGTYPTVLSTMDRCCNASTIAMGTCIAVATLGAIIMPMVVGAVAQRFGIAAGLATIGISLSCMFALIVLKLFGSRRDPSSSS